MDSCNYLIKLKISLSFRTGPLEGPPNKLDVRLLCWILSTSRENENLIRETWGKRCDKLIFISDSPLGPANNRAEGKSDAGAGIVRLFARTTLDVLKQLRDHYLNDSHWFLKADAAT
jgi:glycoprotein-N-acetylgalactosamine 3-beta-galactosyltransferase